MEGDLPGGFDRLDRVLDALAGAYERRDLAALGALIHPEGQLVTRAHGGMIVSGRAAWIDHVRSLDRTSYNVRLLRRHHLDEGAAAEESMLRYPLEGGGFADGPVTWLLEIEDEQLWRATPFRTLEDAADARRARVVDRHAVPADPARHQT
jgi:hypothetical protein